MNKSLKTPINPVRNKFLNGANGVKILILSIIIFGAGFLFVSPANAIALPLTVEWSETGSTWLPLSGPIFSETNFLPGQDVIRLIRVTNNSGQIQRIATEVINENDPDNFSSQLNLTIKEGATVIYNNTLANFFNQGETYLSDLANGNTTQYDFTIVFNSASGNPYEGAILGFDILVGFEGFEGGLPLPPPGGGTDGGLPSGLTIQDESVRITEVGETNVTLIWTTSYFSTSQVIYGAEGEKHNLDLSDNIGSPPKYGYERTTFEYDISPKVTSHSVTITGLTPGTTYYFRAVSHASLAISREYSFETLETKEGQEENIEAEFPGGAGEDGEFGESGISEVAGEVPEGTKKIAEGGQAVTGLAEETNLPNQTLEKDFQPKKGLSALLASIGGIFGKNPFRLLIIILIIILVVLVINWFQKRQQITKKKKKHSQ